MPVYIRNGLSSTPYSNTILPVYRAFLLSTSAT